MGFQYSPQMSKSNENGTSNELTNQKFYPKSKFDLVYEKL